MDKEKQIVKLYRDEISVRDFALSAKAIIKKAKELIEKYGDSVYLTYDYNCDEHYTVYTEILETDEERDDRVKIYDERLKKSVARVNRQNRKDYERLKKIFDKE